jgi:hypothetical protein
LRPERLKPMTAARGLHVTPDHAQGLGAAVVVAFVQDASAPGGSASAAFVASSASASALALAAAAAATRRGSRR